MKLSLTFPQMLEKWKLICGIDAPCSFGMQCDPSLDRSAELLRPMIDAWYRNLLLTAPVSCLAPEDVSGHVALGARNPDGSVTITLDSSVVRVAEVKLSTWLRPATVISGPADHACLHPYTAGTVGDPVAYFSPGFQDTPGSLRLYPGASRGASVDSLLLVTLYDDEYSFDQLALSLIPKITPL